MVMVASFRTFGRTFCIEEKMDDATGDAETYSDHQRLSSSITPRESRRGMPYGEHVLKFAKNLQGKMAERSKACDSSGGVCWQDPSFA